MRLTIFYIWAFVVGSMLFLIYADFEFYHLNEPLDPSRNIWDDLYYIWDTGKDLLIMIFLWKQLALTIKPLIIYCSIRLLWALTIPFTGWDRNHPLTVTMMFTVLLTGVITLLIKDLRMYAQKEL